MNPGSDIGKKELPENLRLKFTEVFVTDIEEKQDLMHLVSEKLSQYCDRLTCEKLVGLFLETKQMCQQNVLEDGYQKKQHISLRNLCRSLNYIRENARFYSLDRALYDGLYLGFATSLSRASQQYFEQQIEKAMGVSAIFY